MATTSAKSRTPVPATERDPRWYQDAVVYQLQVRSFLDSNGDGVGDFPGLTSRLDYLQELGVSAIWLLPFFPSPLRDGGYDIADYQAIHPAYGTLGDFKTFLRQSHRRNLKVITELVLNHTSDQHAWFQRSRHAKEGSQWRDLYVWSDTNEKYAEARIIFQDFETSNWTWDPVANAYYWHRFYHHQPDLNFDNPQVHDLLMKVIDFWLDLGVDGLRLDAVPYLYEREGTNCENLPETHEFLRKLRRHVQQKYPGRLLWAEANQWPEDAAAYFGNGDECHMNFHFPLMPRLFMAIEREDRFPVIDILEQTPPIPEDCQWGIFLRNHDELTLEMVTDEERDYMYRTYADDPQARLNLGIRRRLAPLLRDNRRKMELIHALLLSLPGTPVLYYGDEIGMGDNIYLGDRNGVRTPMQWNDDRNAGFSRANPQRLFLPVIIDAPFHYTSRNVEVEQSRPHSLLWWMRRIIHLRHQHRAFGRGSMEFLLPDNPKVLTYLRRHEDEVLLVIANLSRYAQCAQLDLSSFRGQTPVELFGHTAFPPIGELPYFVTLGPHAFYWFRLEPPRESAQTMDIPLPTCTMTGPWHHIFQGAARRAVEAALPSYLQRSRWFAGKAREVQKATLFDWIALSDAAGGRPGRRRPGVPRAESADCWLLLVHVSYLDGEPEMYLLPAQLHQGERAAERVGDPTAWIEVRRSGTDDRGVLSDASLDPRFWQLLWDSLVREHPLSVPNGTLASWRSNAFGPLMATASDAWETPAADAGHGLAPHHDGSPHRRWKEIQVHRGDQSNSSAFLGRCVLCKVYRRLAEGENPELEMGRFLTESAGLEGVPRILGAIEYRDRDGDRRTLAVFHELIASESDAWTYTLDELDRFLERVESQGLPPPTQTIPPEEQSLLQLAGQEVPNAIRNVIGSYLLSAERLGERTAQLHLALAAGQDPAFRPESFHKHYQRSLYQSMRGEAVRTLGLLRRQRSQLPSSTQALADQLLEQADLPTRRFHTLMESPIIARRIRCHGDYHLGQVLFTGKDFVVIDFEGEPARAISERRIKSSPLRDVAGMVRSLHYATHVALAEHLRTAADSLSAPALLPWLKAWSCWNSATFLRAYLAVASTGEFLPQSASQIATLLDAYCLNKALYELHYELAHRPDWVAIPLEGILQILRSRPFDPAGHDPNQGPGC